MTNIKGFPGLTILMVENEEVTVCLLEFVLQKNGYRVVHSNNGEHAKRLMSTMDPPDAVLIDMILPDTTGLDLLAYLRLQASEAYARLVAADWLAAMNCSAVAEKPLKTPSGGVCGVRWM